MSVESILDGMKQTIKDDGSADYIALAEGLGLTTQIVGILFGIAAAVLAIGVSLVVSLEMLYINMPTLQSAVDNASINHKSVQKIMGICFRDARLAIAEANTVQTGRSVNFVYLRIKLKTIIIAFVVLGLLLGAYNTITLFIVKLVTDII